VRHRGLHEMKLVPWLDESVLVQLLLLRIRGSPPKMKSNELQSSRKEEMRKKSRNRLSIYGNVLLSITMRILKNRMAA
jgi:hypothetical protein